MKQRIIFFLSCAFLYAHCSRILVIPMQGKSHMIATNAIGQELKKNGHEVRSDLCILLKQILQVRESVFLKKGLNIRSLVNNRSPLLSYCISFTPLLAVLYKTMESTKKF